MVLVTDPAPAREVVGVLKTRNAFESTIAALADADIGSGQLSVLSSHESIATANSESTSWRDVLPALVVEANIQRAVSGVWLDRASWRTDGHRCCRYDRCRRRRCGI